MSNSLDLDFVVGSLINLVCLCYVRGVIHFVICAHFCIPTLRKLYKGWPNSDYRTCEGITCIVVERMEV